MRYFLIAACLLSAVPAMADRHREYPSARPPMFEAELTLDIGEGRSGYGIQALWRFSWDARVESFRAPLFLGVKRFWMNGWVGPHLGYGLVDGKNSWLTSVMAQVYTTDRSLIVSVQEDLVVRDRGLQGRMHAGYSHCMEYGWQCSMKDRPRYLFAEAGWFIRHRGVLMRTGPYVTVQGVMMRFGLEYQLGCNEENRGHGVMILTAIDLDKASWIWK